MALAAMLAAGCGSDERPDLCPAMPEQWDYRADFDGVLLRCDVVPELCGLAVDSITREPDLNLAIDVVFVSDGYTAATIGSFRDRVRELVDQLTADGDGIVGRDPTLFNFHRLDLVGEGTEVESRPLRSCVSDLGGESSWFLVGDDARVERAAANAPAVDLLVVIVAGSGGSRGPAGRTVLGTNIVRMSDDVSHRVLTHEMGHALIGLGDEYVELDRRHYLADRYERWTSNPLPPNLSLSPEGDWGGLVTGAIEGGGRYARGVYRPTNRCRMLDAHSDVQFCPVCSAAIDLVLRSRRGTSDGPPRCGLAIGPEQASGHRDLLYFGRDGDGLSALTATVDGMPLPEVDLSAFQPLAARLPVWFEIESGTTGSNEVSVTCTDGREERGAATLGLRP